ncbi:MAG TPA: type II toxin-antitoxin system RelE/ParE family toxin, partial [Gammaproteobacteria bacterium]|nr:type II toxin-antitoxin system RelE/ParE family toxin [Gammaproteobacteria bacterium]
MKKLMTRHFAKWVKKRKLPINELSDALDEVRKGSFEADLGGYLVKKRIRF